jgi:hypothetical protein
LMTHRYGGMLHFLVATFVTAQVSLGSNKVHQQLGMIWGLLWMVSMPWLGVACQGWEVELVRQGDVRLLGFPTICTR